MKSTDRSNPITAAAMQLSAALILIGGLVASAAAQPGHPVRHGHLPGPPHHAPAHGVRHHGRSYGVSHQQRLARDYADTAIAQVSSARRLGYWSSHPRWSTHYGDHYAWALGTRPDRLEQEIHIRERTLIELRVAARNQRRYGLRRY